MRIGCGICTELRRRPTDKQIRWSENEVASVARTTLTKVSVRIEARHFQKLGRPVKFGQVWYLKAIRMLAGPRAAKWTNSTRCS